MGCYLLPQGLSDDIVSALRDYWWSGRTFDRGWPLVAWSSLCRPNRVGGRGFRDLRAINVALLGRQLWRLLHSPNSPVSRVFAAKYYPRGHLLSAELGPRPSYACRSLHRAATSLSDGFYWRIGINSTVRMHMDN
ncbi:uncharacterized mitochondrial protein AtMg00310-like [Hibiscus syriacus]|uniref:uncharacterized mitochondrial protein AtMg00310-like n=1 Tax=Hibiscus syriacus TaxID=106335 RepID=UPI001924FA14|nr:uncharacterized mitochondrial protein AtMg00310-like [Hibiscus syriacus]